MLSPSYIILFKDYKANSVDLDEVAHYELIMSHLIKIYTVCKFSFFTSLLLTELKPFHAYENDVIKNFAVIMNAFIKRVDCMKVHRSSE